ncbi:hypothetical protein [Parafrankia sp. BMG5.11]|nr:hypothetical protein [Parafrankia sp. BMG5.11]
MDGSERSFVHSEATTRGQVTRCSSWYAGSVTADGDGAEPSRAFVGT